MSSTAIISVNTTQQYLSLYFKEMEALQADQLHRMTLNITKAKITLYIFY